MNTDQELATMLWIADLNTTTMGQQTGALIAIDDDPRDTTFCCLGRAGVVLGASRAQDHASLTFYSERGALECNAQPPEHWFEDKTGLRHRFMDECIRMNDELDMDFPQIGKVVYQELLDRVFFNKEDVW